MYDTKMVNPNEDRVEMRLNITRPNSWNGRRKRPTKDNILEMCRPYKIRLKCIDDYGHDKKSMGSGSLSTTCGAEDRIRRRTLLGRPLVGRALDCFC